MIRLNVITPAKIFNSSYNLATIHFLFTANREFKTACVIEIIIMIMRLALTPELEPKVIFLNVSLALALIANHILKEYGDRSLFHKFYASKESLLKFKDLLYARLPERILVFNKKFQVLFSNLSYINTFIGDKNDSQICVTEILQKLKSESQDPNKNNQESTLYSNLIQISANGNEERSEFFSYPAEKLAPSKYFHVKALPFLWDGQDSTLVILNDITDHRDNLSLKLADANKDKVISTISHELRTPVNGMLGMIQIMQMQTNNRELQESLTICQRNGNLLLNMINSILDLQQIRANKLKLNITQVKIQELMKNVFILFEYQTKQKKLSLNLELDDSSLPRHLYTDQNRLSQILINLTGNALKFTFQGGITMGAKIDPENKEHILFWVSDTGTGIKEEDKGKLFKMFGKLEATTNINTQGVGLGLTISQNLVNVLNKEDGSHIKLESEYGKGTRFFFSIPIKYVTGEPEITLSIATEDLDEMLFTEMNAPMSVKHEKSPVSSFASSRKYTYTEESRALISQGPTSSELIMPISSSFVVLVDDNPFNLLVAEKLLQEQSFQVVSVYNGVQAIETVKDIVSKGNTVKFILMDCQMPVMDGYQATIELRDLMKKGELDKIPIMALSANNSEEDRKKCIDAGMDDYISKPLIRGDLIKQLKKWDLM
jgi:signal transduction histidine kinase/CheY-like chemotaxis protein